MDDDEDPVVEEIPVFLSKNLNDSLYLFQYPTITQLPNHDDAVVVNCCVKPFSQEIKVDFGLSLESSHYDRFKAEQFAIAADGKPSYGLSTNQAKGSERPTYKRGIMDKQSFVSSRSLTDISKYIVGIYTDKEVHLSPLTSIVQLRPSFTHFDKEDKRRKAEQKTQNEETDDDEVVQQVTVKFARGGAVGKKVKEQRGYDSFLKRIVDEPWCETYWHARNTPTAELERQKLFATNHQSNQSFALQASEYLLKLLPREEQHESNPNIHPVYSKTMLKGMTLIDQLRILLNDAKMLSFNDILNILTTHINPHTAADKVLALLPQVGILLLGNWVPKSEVLYTENMVSNANGINAEQMIRARDYVLYKFSRMPCLHRTQVMVATQLPSAETFDVLSSVARVNATKRWELLLPPDKEFEQKHPELVQRQELIWRSSEQMYNEMDWAKETKRVRKRSTRKSESQGQSKESTAITS